ncbi:hypothetical protein HD554DRAFT_2038918 [Boletus coccyginus]|nr:hypothetical protein HD554DRAFT_2038918 [Boletus coccyginus]
MAPPPWTTPEQAEFLKSQLDAYQTRTRDKDYMQFWITLGGQSERRVLKLGKAIEVRKSIIVLKTGHWYTEVEIYSREYHDRVQPKVDAAKKSGRISLGAQQLVETYKGWEVNLTNQFNYHTDVTPQGSIFPDLFPIQEKTFLAAFHKFTEAVFPVSQCIPSSPHLNNEAQDNSITNPKTATDLGDSITADEDDTGLNEDDAGGQMNGQWGADGVDDGREGEMDSDTSEKQGVVDNTNDREDGSAVDNGYNEHRMGETEMTPIRTALNIGYQGSNNTSLTIAGTGYISLVPGVDASVMQDHASMLLYGGYYTTVPNASPLCFLILILLDSRAMTNKSQLELSFLGTPSLMHLPPSHLAWQLHSMTFVGWNPRCVYAPPTLFSQGITFSQAMGNAMFPFTSTTWNFLGADLLQLPDPPMSSKHSTVSLESMLPPITMVSSLTQISADFPASGTSKNATNIIQNLQKRGANEAGSPGAKTNKCKTK